MANSDDGSIAPRRSLGGPILPPPPPALAEDARKAEDDKAAAERAQAQQEADRQAQAAEKQAREAARQRQADQRAADKQAQRQAAEQAKQQAREAKEQSKRARSAKPAQPTKATRASTQGATGGGPRRSRRAQLRLVQVDAWSVMKTSFLLSIALGIVLVVAVAIIMGVLGAAGVWDSINSIVKQAVGGEGGQQFDIEQYVGTSRIVGFTMIVAVIDVILITAIATLGAFLYNLAAALLGGIEVTLAEDS
jgi:hypothetical protein